MSHSRPAEEERRGDESPKAGERRVGQTRSCYCRLSFRCEKCGLTFPTQLDIRTHDCIKDKKETAPKKAAPKRKAKKSNLVDEVERYKSIKGLACLVC